MSNMRQNKNNFQSASIDRDGILDMILEKISKLEKALHINSKPFLNVKELSKLTGIPQNTIYQYTHNNIIPYHKVGKRIFFNREEIEAFILDDMKRYKSSKEIEAEAKRYAATSGW